MSRLKYLPIALTLLVIAILWAPSLWLASQALQVLAARPQVLGDALPIRGAARAMFENTLALVVLTELFAILFGVICGIAIARLPGKARGALQVLVALPLALPPTLLATAFLEWSRLPPLRSLASLGAERALPIPPVFVAALVLAACFFPAIALPVGAALRAVPPEADEAARLFGSRAQRWTQVLGPIIWPALASGAGIVAALSMWEMGAPDLLDVRSYSVQIYRNLSAADALDPRGKAAHAALSALPLLLLSALALWPASRLFRHAARFSPHEDRGTSQISNTSRIAITLASGVVMFSLAAPLGVFAANWDLATAQQVLRANAIEIENTFVAATLSATWNIALALALVLGWRAWNPKWHRAARVVVCAPLLMAPVLLGVALLGATNQPFLDWLIGGWESDNLVWNFVGERVGRYALLELGFTCRFLPLAVWMLDAAFASRGAEMEDAARNIGASTWQATRDIVLPLARPWIVSVWALVWVLSAGELSLAVLINAPGGQTLPVPIFNLMHIGATSEVASLSIIALAQAAVAIGIAVWLSGGKRPKMKRR